MERETNAYAAIYAEGAAERWAFEQLAADPSLLRAAVVLLAKPRRRAALKAPRDPGMRILYDEFIRQNTDLTKFARWCGVSRQTIWNWFSEINYPQPKNRQKLLERTLIAIPPKARPRRRR